jgi:5-methylcytosine-specific restriction endonuclease McrA
MPKNLFGTPNLSDLSLGVKEKPKRKRIPKAVREQVWNKYVGATKRVGKCYCCRWRPITDSEFEVGHNKAVAKDGKDNINNLRPICRPCNSSMGTMSIEQYRKKYHAKPKEKVKRTKSKPKRKVEKKKTPNILDVPKIKLPKTPF